MSMGRPRYRCATIDCPMGTRSSRLVRKIPRPWQESAGLIMNICDDLPSGPNSCLKEVVSEGSTQLHGVEGLGWVGMPPCETSPRPQGRPMPTNLRGMNSYSRGKVFCILPRLRAREVLLETCPMPGK